MCACWLNVRARSCAGDVATGKAILRQIEIMDQVWAKWNSILGWPVQGIWSIEDDGTDINNVDVSSQGHLLLAA